MSAPSKTRPARHSPKGAVRTAPVARPAVAVRRRPAGPRAPQPAPPIRPSEVEPDRRRLIPLLRRLGTACPGGLIHRYGVHNVAAALYYVACQKGRYLPRNPGGLVTWLLAAYEERRLQGWQLKRILTLATRFTDIPGWVRFRFFLWARELHQAWLGEKNWERLRRRYGLSHMERLLREHPHAHIWRSLRRLLAERYRLLPMRLAGLVSEAAALWQRLVAEGTGATAAGETALLA